MPYEKQGILKVHTNLSKNRMKLLDAMRICPHIKLSTCLSMHIRSPMEFYEGFRRPPQQTDKALTSPKITEASTKTFFS